MLPADLNVVLIGNALEPRPIFHQVRQADVDGGSHRRAKVRRARRDVPQVIVVGELGHGLNVLGSTSKPLKDGSNISTGLHRDDAQLVLLVHPDEESLRVVVEDATALGPVAVEAARLKEAVPLLEQEMICNELLLRGLVHALKRVKAAGEVSLKCIARLGHLRHDLVPLLVGDAWA